LRCVVSILWVVALAAATVAISALPAFAEPPRDPADRLRENDASNLGICSVELGRQGLRDDVATRLAQQGDLFGLKNPGELYSARAQQRGGDEKCEQRR
jgi:hypothetical protein